MGKYSPEGLKAIDVEKQRKIYGTNEIIKNKKSNPLKKFIGVFKEPMFLLLIGAAAIYIILGEPREACIMLVFVIFVATITFVQEWKTEKTVEALKVLTSPKVKALRDGEIITINSIELVPGDVIFLSEGERIPADAQVLSASNFSVDESALTGEAEPVFKVQGEDDEDDSGYFKKYMIYAGTLSTFGKCTAVVINTGLNTEYGKIGKAIMNAKEKSSPLEKKIHALVKNLALLGCILCTLVIMFSYFYTHNIINSILSGITLAMAIIPEEFPVVLVIFLSLGALRLAKKNTLMRKVSAVETLGSTTVLCVDKTGTITQNSMKVRSIYDGSAMLEPSLLKDHALSKLMILSSERDPYDPMEKAIVEAAGKNADINKTYNMELACKIAFDSRTKRMVNVFKQTDNRYYAACKGSPETVLPLCNLGSDEFSSIFEKVNEMASKGLRVLALADALSDNVFESAEKYPFKFKGLVGLQDPPKEGVEKAINICERAGVRVVMITGDYMKTAVAIGREIGLKYGDHAITGDEIEKMSEDELCNAVKDCDIFSRVIPEHKMKIVKALQQNGEIVAMTGDGVNDATALKAADIGIAMGKRGTEVAKEAAHMILMDDNFTTIVESVKDGRRVFDNIRKAMVYILIIHIPIIALALCSPIFNLPQILLPVHIVLLELIIDPTCSIVFESQPAEGYIMDQPPRSPNEPLLTRSLGIKVILQGASMFLAAFMPFHFMVDAGINVETARSFSFMALIISSVILVLVNRSNTSYLIGIFKEKVSRAGLIINSTAIIMVFAIVYIPILQSVFMTEELPLSMCLCACALGVISTGWWEICKLFVNRRSKIQRMCQLDR
jgi:P-type Ca2+ transporter type 2C